MEAANKGVIRGREASGSKSMSYGISIELNSFEQITSHFDTKHHHRKFSSRLDDFMRLSNAIVVTPGGVGTLLELYFSWQLVQVGHLPVRPIILLGKDFWQGLIDWMKEKQLKGGLVSPGDFDWIAVVDTPEEAVKIIKEEHAKFNALRANKTS
jgi:predicted Rossmann-fold nucleotide-binding protein